MTREKMRIVGVGVLEDYTMTFAPLNYYMREGDKYFRSSVLLDQGIKGG